MPNNAVQVGVGLYTDKASLNQSTREIKGALGRITGNASEFQKSLDASTARVFAFGATTTVISGVSLAFQALISTTIEVEKRLVEINSIFGGTTSQLNQFRETIFQVAKDTGQSFSTVADAASEFARQGLSATETAKRLNDALILSRISGLDSVKSVKTLTAAINGFTSAGLSSTQVVDKITAVDRKFAVSAEDLSNGLARAGSTAEDAGVSFDELLGIITAVEQRTSRGGAVIGNALKTIFTRISRGGVIEDLQALGVAIDASQSGVQKLQAIGDAFESALGDPTRQNAIKELAAGGFQINIISAALKDLTSQSSAFGEATKVAQDSAGTAAKENAELQKSLAAQLNSLVVGFTNLAEKVGSITLSPLLKGLTEAAGLIDEFLNKALDPEKGNALVQGLLKTIGAFVSGPGLVLIATGFFKIIKLVAGFAKEGFKTVLALGSAAENIRTIEKAIVGQLHEGSALRTTMLSTTATQAQKQQAVNKALSDANELHLREQNILRETAQIAAGLGVRGRTDAGIYTGKGGKPLKAKGFTPSFSETVAETSAAREHGYKAGKVFNTKLYDGQGGSFKATVNSAEKIKTVRGENGKLGTYVIPPNGMAAKGFVPNYAGFNNIRFNDALKDLGRLSVAQLQKKLVGARTTPEEKAAGEQILAKKLSEQKTKEADRTKISGASYGMLVPSRGTIRTESPLEGSLNGKLFSVDNFNIRGPDFSKVDSIASPQDEKLKKNITSQILTESTKFANSLGGSTVDAGGILGQLSKSQGALGGINSAVGAAFDLAVASAFPISKYQEAETNALNKIGGNFDVRNIGSNLKNLFNLPSSVSKADFKATDSTGNRSSMVGKMMKEQGVSSAQKASTTTFLKDQEKRGKFKAGGFVPNFAPFKKDSIGDGRKKYSTSFGSYANVFPDSSRKQINLDYISSKKKGDAYKLFKHLSKIAKRSKSSIYASELVPQIKDESDPFSKAEKGSTNWEKLLSIFPQLKYRQLPKSTTSGNVTSRSSSFDGFGFESLDGLEGLVNGMSKKQFEDDFSEADISNIRTKMLGGGFIPNFANIFKSFPQKQERQSFVSQAIKGNSKVLSLMQNAGVNLKPSRFGQQPDSRKLKKLFELKDSQQPFNSFFNKAYETADMKSPTGASEEQMLAEFWKMYGSNPAVQKEYANIKGGGFVPNFADPNKLMKGRNADQISWIKASAAKLNLPLNGETYAQFAKLYEKNVSVNRVDKSGRASTQGMLNLFGGGFIPNFARFKSQPFFNKDGSRKRGEISFANGATKEGINSLAKAAGLEFGSDGMPVKNKQNAFLFNKFLNAGQSERMTIYNEPDGTKHVKDGNHRLTLGRYLGLKTFNNVDFKASGFIPNFSAVQDAISREKKAGVPSSAIYIDQSPKLKSTRNPSGLMVANRIDEPRGGFQGINRAKKEGKNPKSYGAAGGFVPNFAVPQIADFSSNKNDQKVQKFQRSLDFLFEAFEDGNIKLKLVTQSAKDIAKELGITGDKAREFRKSVQASAFEMSKPKPNKYEVPIGSGGNPLPHTDSSRARSARGGWTGWNEPNLPLAKLKGKKNESSKKPVEPFISTKGLSNKAKKKELEEYSLINPKKKTLTERIGGALERGKGAVGNPVALSIGLSTISGFTEELKNSESNVKSAAGEIISTTAEMAAAGSAFGVFGTAIGAGAGLIYTFFDALNKEAKLSADLREKETRYNREGGALTEVRREEGNVFNTANAKSLNISSISDLKKQSKKNNSNIDFDLLSRLKQDVVTKRADDFEVSASKGPDSEERQISLKQFEEAEKKYIRKLQEAVDSVLSKKSVVNVYKYIDELGVSFLKASRLIDDANQKLDQNLSNLEIAGGVELNSKNPRSKYLEKRIELQNKKTSADRSLGGFKKDFFSKAFSDVLKSGADKRKTLDLSRTAKPLPSGYQLPSFTEKKSLSSLNPLAPPNILGNTKRNFLNESSKLSEIKPPSSLKTKNTSFEELAGFREKTIQELLKEASVDPEKLQAKVQKGFNFEGGRAGVEKALSSSGINTQSPEGVSFIDALTEKLGPLREAILGSAQAAENYKSSLEDTIKGLNEQIKNNLPNLFSSITKDFGGDKVDPSKFAADYQKAIQEKDIKKQGRAFKELEAGGESIKTQFGEDYFNNLITNATKSAGKALPASDFATKDLNASQRERDIAKKNVNDTLFAKGSTDPASIKAVEDLRIAEEKLAESRRAYQTDIKENGVSNLLSNVSGKAATSQFDTNSLVESARPSLSGQGRAQAESARKALEKDPESIKAINDLISALKENAVGDKSKEKLAPQIAALEARRDTKFKNKSGGDLTGEKNLAQEELKAVNKELAKMAQDFRDSGLPEAVKNLTVSMRKATETTDAFNKFSEELKNLSTAAISKMSEATSRIKSIEFRVAAVEKGGKQ